MKKSISIQLPSSSKFIDFALTLLAKGSNSWTPLYLSYSTAQPPKAPQSDNCVGLDLIQKLPKSGNVPILLNLEFFMTSTSHRASEEYPPWFSTITSIPKGLENSPRANKDSDAYLLTSDSLPLPAAFTLI